jgi:archaellum component FlaF (FlaF/FlaG flagellin family)
MFFFSSLLHPLGRKRTSGRTVRFMFPVFMSAAALMGAAVMTSQDVSYVRLVPSVTSIEKGEEFYIDVYAYAHVPVNTVDITIDFDPDAVEVQAVDVGQSVITLWTEEPRIDKSSVMLRGGTYRNGFLNEHMIARIDLRGKETGLSSFSATDVILLAGDGTGSAVAVAEATDTSVNFYIYDENSSPDEIEINVELRVVTDIDGDGKVSLKDVSAFMGAWHTKNKIYDFNGDGRMTIKDFSIILADVFFGS